MTQRSDVTRGWNGLLLSAAAAGEDHNQDTEQTPSPVQPPSRPEHVGQDYRSPRTA
jgi:hypothetical protein